MTSSELNAYPQDIRRNSRCSPLISSRSSMSLSTPSVRSISSFFPRVKFVIGYLITVKARTTSRLVRSLSWLRIDPSSMTNNCPNRLLRAMVRSTWRIRWTWNMNRSLRRTTMAFCSAVVCRGISRVHWNFSSGLLFTGRTETGLSIWRTSRKCFSSDRSMWKWRRPQRQQEWHVDVSHAVSVLRDPWTSWIDLDDDSDDEQSGDLDDQSDTCVRDDQRTTFVFLADDGSVKTLSTDMDKCNYWFNQSSKKNKYFPPVEFDLSEDKLDYETFPFHAILSDHREEGSPRLAHWHLSFHSERVRTRLGKQLDRKGMADGRPISVDLFWHNNVVAPTLCHWSRGRAIGSVVLRRDEIRSERNWSRSFRFVQRNSCSVMSGKIFSFPFCFFLQVNTLLLIRSIPSVHCAVKVVRARFSLSRSSPARTVEGEWLVLPRLIFSNGSFLSRSI